MSLWTRITNLFRSDRLSREIDEELQLHIEDAIAAGRDPEEVRRAFGSLLRNREESRDVRVLTWLDSLRADAIFGWRQLVKHRVASAAAILSLALAIGACTSAFRLVDALLLRPLPVAGVDRLYSVTFQSPSASDGTVVKYDSCSYPMFLRMRAAIASDADSLAVSMYNGPADLTYGSDQEMEHADVQYVSGAMFDLFDLRPAAGRLLGSADDGAPGTRPYVVVSYEYWARRFGKSPEVIGRALRVGNTSYEIVGVAPEGFTGTETGLTKDIFVPIAMYNPRTLASLNNFWMRTLVRLKPGVAQSPVEEKLRAAFQSIQEERVKGFPAQSQRDRERFFQERLSIEPASAGRSNLQRDFRQALFILGILVALVLLIACANTANLMAAQAASRSREMAMRVSLGAGRIRLVQLVLVESAWLAVFASAIGGIFTWWAAPVIVHMIRLGSYPARLDLPIDWRVLGFSTALACTVALLGGLAPALRASGVTPSDALRGGSDPHSRGRLAGLLIAAQVAFCFLVNLAGGLFLTTFERLSTQPTGFSSERILNLETVTTTPQPSVLWQQVAERLRDAAGVEGVALIGWPLMNGESAVGNISIDGAPPSDVFADFVTISQGWAELMRIPILSGRDFRATDVYPGTAIVNQVFAKQYFHGDNPVGKWFERVEPAGGRSRFQVAGLIRDARSRSSLRLAIRPTVYVPFSPVVARGTFVLRTATPNPLALAAALRKEVAEARPGFRVKDVRTQTELVQIDMVRERILAVLATFFAGFALLLAGIGLYGVLDDSVTKRRREIGIRLAIGARSKDIARGVANEILAMVFIGAIAGVAVGLASTRYVASLLFGVKATDWTMLAIPALTIATAVIAAALPAVVRALRIDPVSMLRRD